MTKMKIKEYKDFTSEEMERANIMEEDQRYVDLLVEIDKDRERKDLILRGAETPGNLLGFRGFDQKRYYSDLAKRMNDSKIEHMKKLHADGTRDHALDRYLEVIKKRGLSEDKK